MIKTLYRKLNVDNMDISDDIPDEIIDSWKELQAYLGYIRENSLISATR